ncbi:MULTISPECIES: pyridoxine 5'-phosphate oxidase C-terminal domain-containing protein [unclassified Mycobacterium]
MPRVRRAHAFWQGSPDRKHLRIGYQRTDDGWERTQLWP